MELSNDEILNKFPEKIKQNIKSLLLETPSGLSCMNMRVNLNNFKLSHDADVLKGNSFILEIPYAGKHLNWEVIFNDEDLSFAPDFDFINDLFLMDPDIDVIEKEIPSLAEWNVDDKKCLKNVIKEFLILYKKYQIARLEEDKFQRQSTEYALLKSETGIEEDCMEIFIDHNDSVHFLILIKADYANLPPYLQTEYFENGEILNPSEDSATLKVSFAGNRVTPNLQLSPKLESLIGSAAHLHIPSFNKESGLVEYVPVVSNLIKDKIDAISKSYNMRNEFMSTLLAVHGNGILEYDNVYYYKITLLLEVENVHAVVSITLGKQFPQERPIIQLSSICHEENGKTRMDNFPNFPYGPKWSVEQMVHEILTFLLKAVPKFKYECVNFRK